MPVVDVAAFVGGYPYRHLKDPSAEWLIRQMDRLGIERAWVAYLPALLHRDPAASTPELLELIKHHRDRLQPVPTIHPGLPRWEEDLNDAVALGAPAVRVHPRYLGLDPVGGEMRVLAAAAGAAGMPLLLAVRLEDPRQLHPLDPAGELPGAAIRGLIRSDPQLKLIVSHAERAIIEEVHWGLTPQESSRILWDIAWVWGPPEDHLALLIETMGVERFVLGTGMPLRIPDTPFARLDLLNLSAQDREKILSKNLETW
ncbi:MAG: amidohydrolase family protein [Gemmatimonadetes bacterium]|nr:amidohydrolase family protein [Gemmatimonadota bacterium]